MNRLAKAHKYLVLFLLIAGFLRVSPRRLRIIRLGQFSSSSPTLRVEQRTFSGGAPRTRFRNILACLWP